VARIYAGVLGLLAFLTCLARGLAHGAGAESALWLACGSMLVFAAIGLAVGACAGWIVEDSVRQRLAAQWAAEEAAQSAPPAKTETTGS
jgi:hypothetical protein